MTKIHQYNMKKVLTSILLIGLSANICHSKDLKNNILNLSVGDIDLSLSLLSNNKLIEASFGTSPSIMLNYSNENLGKGKFKLGIDGNLVYRSVYSENQGVVDVKVYKNIKLSKESNKTYLKIGFGVNTTQTTTSDTTNTGYAPVIGISISSGKFYMKLMGSIFKDSIAIPYQIGRMTDKSFLGFQGICSLSLQQYTIFINTGIGLCYGRKW